MSSLARLLLLLLSGYQRVSAHLPARCRFYPSCSAYAVEAIGLHGALRGTALAVRRLLRCGPWHPGGVDPVPPRRPGRDQRDRRARSTEEQAPC